MRRIQRKKQLTSRLNDCTDVLSTGPKTIQYNAEYIGKGMDAKTAPKLPTKT